MSDEQVEAAVQFTIDNWDALGVQEQDGVPHLPATIKRRNAKGGTDGHPVMLRNITNLQKYQARTEARAYAQKLKLDLDRDAALVDELENFAILSYAVREPKPPFDRHVPGLDHLVQLYEAQSLYELWGRFNTWVEMLDPRFGSMDPEQLWQVIARVAKERNPAPLASMPGHVQYTCIVLMAREACHSPNRPSWLQPLETFRQGS